jgi:hypothetical protein
MGNKGKRQSNASMHESSLVVNLKDDGEAGWSQKGRAAAEPSRGGAIGCRIGNERIKPDTWRDIDRLEMRRSGDG